MSFHVEFHPPGLPGRGQKVCGGGWVVGGGGVETDFSVQLGTS